MVSAQVGGMIRSYKKKPSGEMTPIVQARVEDTAPAGGASEGAGSSVATPEKRIFVDSPVILVTNDILLATFEPDAGATLDATDCVWSIPLITNQGTKQLGRTQFTNPTLPDQVLSASVEATIAGYTITEQSAKLKGRIYLDIQNNA